MVCLPGLAFVREQLEEILVKNNNHILIPSLFP